jgi:hypothetical protein
MEDLTLFVPTNNSFKLVVSEEKMFNVSANQEEEFPNVAMLFAGSREMRNFCREPDKYHSCKGWFKLA